MDNEAGDDDGDDDNDGDYSSYDDIVSTKRRPIGRIVMEVVVVKEALEAK